MWDPVGGTREREKPHGRSQGASLNQTARGCRESSLVSPHGTFLPRHAPSPEIPSRGARPALCPWPACVRKPSVGWRERGVCTGLSPPRETCPCTSRQGANDPEGNCFRGPWHLGCLPSTEVQARVGDLGKGRFNNQERWLPDCWALQLCVACARFLPRHVAFQAGLFL